MNFSIIKVLFFFLSQKSLCFKTSHVMVSGLNCFGQEHLSLLGIQHFPMILFFSKLPKKLGFCAILSTVKRFTSNVYW